MSVGRGRGRGLVSEMREVSGPRFGQGVGPGKIMVGRGNLLLQDNHPTSPGSIENGQSFEADLLSLAQSKKETFIHLSLRYFEINSNEDSSHVKDYMDKVINTVLKSSFLVEKFTMNLKLLSYLKKHGQHVKQEMFNKLQSTFTEMKILMEEPGSLSKIEMETVRNFCSLLGQIYFRFRVTLGGAEKYSVLAGPCLYCMNYLLSAGDHHDLLLLNKLIVFNYSSIREISPEESNRFEVNIRQSLWKSSDTETIKGLLMSALELVVGGGRLSVGNIGQFYTEKLGRTWTEAVLTTRVQLLADIPADIVASHMHRFSITAQHYVQHLFITL